MFEIAHLQERITPMVDSLELRIALVLVIIAAGIATFFSARSAKKELMVEPWQDMVEPERTNLSITDFDRLKHFLLDATPDQYDDETIEQDIENRVYAAYRRHGLYLGLRLMLSFGLIVFGSFLIYVLMRLDTSTVVAISPVRIGLLFILAGIGWGFYHWYKWRYTVYMLTNQAIHVILQPPPVLSLLPSRHRRLELERVAQASEEDNFAGSFGITTVIIGTYMSGKEDEPFNNMTFMPTEADFKTTVQRLTRHRGTRA